MSKNKNTGHIKIKKSLNNITEYWIPYHLYDEYKDEDGILRIYNEDNKIICIMRNFNLVVPVNEE